MMVGARGQVEEEGCIEGTENNNKIEQANKGKWW